jgi:hypothetical protein
MRHHPKAADLLETARAVLRETILPQLPPSARYEALMVANAMAIAARQVAAGERPAEEAGRRLAAIYGLPAEPEPDAGGLERQLAADLRRGAFDEPGRARDAVFDHLWRTASDRAAESNPKALRRGK